jgi:predicted TIM-barrel fold metal-dependent hydrolase
MPVNRIAIEEHFWTPELRDTRRGYDILPNPEHGRRLGDLGELRLREMDEAGIAMQVISHVEPAAQSFDPVDGVRLARDANDMLYRAIQSHPTRFAGLAALPSSDPAASAVELQRAVRQLGFKGAILHGLTHGAFPDEKPFWPILETAHRLDVPIYVHPATPHPAVIEAYYKGFPAMVRVGHGFTAEAAAIATRLILSDVFDIFPRLQIILGHLGEALPFLLPRIDGFVSPQMKKPRTFADTLRNNFYFTTSGKFSHSALQCTIEAIGIERLMFAVDWPFRSNADGRDFIDGAPLSDDAKARIFEGNARRLLRL